MAPGARAFVPLGGAAPALLARVVALLPFFDLLRFTAIGGGPEPHCAGLYGDAMPPAHCDAVAGRLGAPSFPPIVVGSRSAAVRSQVRFPRSRFPAPAGTAVIAAAPVFALARVGGGGVRDVVGADPAVIKSPREGPGAAAPGPRRARCGPFGIGGTLNGCGCCNGTNGERTPFAPAVRADAGGVRGVAGDGADGCRTGVRVGVTQRLAAVVGDGWAATDSLDGPPPACS